MRRCGSHRQRWDAPRPDGERPEAEWGFESALREDIVQWAQCKGYRICRIVFREPQDLSWLVADLYRWWYRQRGLPANRLLGKSFIFLNPWWTLRIGAVPYWSFFTVQPAANALESYLKNTEPYDYIHLLLFAHGIKSLGIAPLERWYSILRHARRTGSLIGIDEQAFPLDLGIFIRYRHELKTIPERYPLPEPLTLTQLDLFLQQKGSKYPVKWIEHAT